MSQATDHKIVKCPQCREDVLTHWEDCLHCGYVLPKADWRTAPPPVSVAPEATDMPAPKVAPPAAVPAGPGYLYYPPPAPVAYQAPYQSAKTNGFAIAALVLGIIWVYWIGSILALVFGYVARRQIADSGGTQQGGGLAVAGIVLGWIGVSSFVFMVLIFAIANSGGT